VTERGDGHRHASTCAAATPSDEDPVVPRPVDNLWTGPPDARWYRAAVDRLLPRHERDIDPVGAIAAEPRRRPDGRPWVLADMVTAPDGTIALDGRSRPLGSPGDTAVFHALRAAADVVLVGAGTARAERYRLPADAGPAGGAGPDTALCVVSASLDLDDDLPFLDHGCTDPAQWPVVATTATAPEERRTRLAGRAHVVVAGTDSVEPERLLDELARRGHGTVLCEGGPTLLAQLAAADLVDEWALTLAPWMAGGGEGDRLLPHPLHPPRRLRLDRLFAEDDHLFLRYLRG